MNRPREKSIMIRLAEARPSLTPKGRLLADFVAHNPRQAVFMTTRRLARAAGVSEATVVRFIGRLGYAGYPAFIQDLRAHVDAALTLVDRTALGGPAGPIGRRLGRVIDEETANLREFYKSADPAALDRSVGLLLNSPVIYVIGARISYAFAHYLGWSLSLLRDGVDIYNGADSTTLDRLNLSPPTSLVVVFSISRYPRELTRAAELAQRLGRKLIVISDSAACPANRLGGLNIVTRSLHFPLVGSPSPMLALANHLVAEVAARGGEAVRRHQESLERAYQEHGVFAET